jgi:hypothetical protein
MIFLLSPVFDKILSIIQILWKEVKNLTGLWGYLRTTFFESFFESLVLSWD